MTIRTVTGPKLVLSWYFTCGLLVIFLCSNLSRIAFQNNYSSSVGSLKQSCGSIPYIKMNSFEPRPPRSEHEGVETQYMETRTQKLPWDVIVDSKFIYPVIEDSKKSTFTFDPSIDADVHDITNIASKILPDQSHIASFHGFSLAVRKNMTISWIYRRLDRIRGVQYIMQVRYHNFGCLSNNPVTILVHKPTGPIPCQIAVRKVERSTKEKLRLYIVLPYTSRGTQIERFVKQFLFLMDSRSSNYSLFLVISVVRKSADVTFVQNLIARIACDRTDWRKFVWICENGGDISGRFSRSVAIREAVKEVSKRDLSSDSIIFICDVDLLVTEPFLERCELNSITGSQVYYPIFYNLYPYANNSGSIGRRMGFWRTGSYGMLCIRKADFDEVAPFNDAEKRFQGWGNEDVHLYETIDHQRKLSIFRAVEPGLIHYWHAKRCPTDIPEYKECVKSRIDSIAHPLEMGMTLNRLLPDIGMLEIEA